MRQTNKTATRTYYKPGERRKEMKYKNKQEDFTKVNNTESFPTLGSGAPTLPSIPNIEIN